MPRTIPVSVSIQPATLFTTYQGSDIRAIFTDLDGTALKDGSSDNFSPAFLKEARLAAAAGMTLQIQTAMGLVKARDKIQALMDAVHTTKLGHKAARYHSLSNGTQVYDAVKDNIEQEFHIDPSVAAQSLRWLQAKGMRYFINDATYGRDVAPMAEPWM